MTTLFSLSCPIYKALGARKLKHIYKWPKVCQVFIIKCNQNPSAGFTLICWIYTVVTVLPALHSTLNHNLTCTSPKMSLMVVRPQQLWLASLVVVYFLHLWCFIPCYCRINIDQTEESLPLTSKHYYVYSFNSWSEHYKDSPLDTHFWNKRPQLDNFN